MDPTREYLRGARRKAREARDYFDDDDDVDDLDNSRGAQTGASATVDTDVDPLDAFMVGIESQVARERVQQQPAAAKVRVF